VVGNPYAWSSWRELKILLVLLRPVFNNIRELKIHDAGGSTTRSEFQLKNER
jgi:hypothetical protein